MLRFIICKSLQMTAHHLFLEMKCLEYSTTWPFMSTWLLSGYNGTLSSCDGEFMAHIAQNIYCNLALCRKTLLTPDFLCQFRWQCSRFSYHNLRRFSMGAQHRWMGIELHASFIHNRNQVKKSACTSQWVQKIHEWKKLKLINQNASWKSKTRPKQKVDMYILKIGSVKVTLFENPIIVTPKHVLFWLCYFIVWCGEEAIRILVSLMLCSKYWTNTVRMKNDSHSRHALQQIWALSGKNI